MRIGIHHGPAVVGNFGNPKRSDYSAIGSTVNIASRIESVCEPGAVFLSDTLCNLIDRRQFVHAGSFALKGIDGKITLYKLTLSS